MLSVDTLFFSSIMKYILGGALKEAVIGHFGTGLDNTQLFEGNIRELILRDPCCVINEHKLLGVLASCSGYSM